MCYDTNSALSSPPFVSLEPDRQRQCCLDRLPGCYALCCPLGIAVWNLCAPVVYVKPLTSGHRDDYEVFGVSAFVDLVVLVLRSIHVITTFPFVFRSVAYHSRAMYGSGPTIAHIAPSGILLNGPEYSEPKNCRFSISMRLPSLMACKSSALVFGLSPSTQQPCMN